MIQPLWQDLRYGIRMLAKHPAFTVVAVLMLGLGIGANTAVFSVVYSVMLKPLPYRAPDRLVALWSLRRGSSSLPFPAAPAVFLDWRERNNVFEDVAAYEDASISHRPRFFLSGGDTPERIFGVRVSVNIFSVLGVRAAKGRTFLPEEEEPGQQPVAILSDDLWKSGFASDPEIIGKTIKVNNVIRTIVGVMPPDVKLSYPRGADLWTPIEFGASARNNRGEVAYKVIARLKPGVTLAQAQEAMQLLARLLEQQYPETDRQSDVSVVSLHEDIFGKNRAPLLILAVAVAFVLLIACLNAGNLLLSRALERSREISIRAALGASRWRIVRQLLTESMLLALLGGALGILLTVWAKGFLVSLIPASVARGDSIAIDRWVLAFTMSLTFLTGIVFGLLPALQSSKASLAGALKSAGQNVTASTRARRLRSFIVVLEAALSLVLLAGAGLMIKSLWLLDRVEPGVQAAHLLTMQFTIPRYKLPEEQQQAVFAGRVLDRIRALPGVVSAASTTSVPMRGVDYTVRFDLAGQPASQDLPSLAARWRVVSPGYFETMGIPLLKGRSFTEYDIPATPEVAVVSESFARAFFPSEDPLGKRIKITKREAEIVGVVGDDRHAGPRKPGEPAIYEAMNQTPMDPVCLVVRTAGDPLSLAGAVKQAVWAEDRDQPVENVSTMDEIVAAATADTRFYSTVLTIFAFISLALGATGIYGVVSYTTTQRTYEIGVRIALGAETRDIARLVIGQGMAGVVTGVILGVVASIALTRALTSLVFDVSLTDPLTYVVVAVILMLTALLACYLPARRATKVDPMIALRHE
ncbi:MAG: ABC transporter permease [Acidobacteriota bacterium]